MLITKQHIEDLLHLMTFGLIHGAGNEWQAADNKFCVQQAVHKVITGDLDKYATDHPYQCVQESLNSFGIRLNDATGWAGDKQRSEGLKRFAIAEMGTADMEEFSMDTFYTKLCDKLHMNESHSEDVVEDYVFRNEGTPGAKLTHVANMAAEVLKEMGTPGSEFLYLVDEPDKKKREKAAREKAMKDHPEYSAHIANFGFSTDYCKHTPKCKQ